MIKPHIYLEISIYYLNLQKTLKFDVYKTFLTTMINYPKREIHYTTN